MLKALDRFSAGIDWFNERLGRIVCWLTLAMVLIASYNTIARYSGRYFGINLTSNALLELQWYLFSAVFLLGGAYALKCNAHVRVDVVFERLNPKTRAWINLAGTFLFLIPFSCMMLWATWGSVASSWEILEQSSDPGGLPRYPVKSLIPIAFVLLIFQGLSEAVKQLRILCGAADPSVVERDSI
jgi:TRAP-type mannitol/chloroaromatic compound transport system permease small subunit